MKKNAFTLIELLAVIVILAIISLIAVPIVINIINNTKDESIKRGINLYLNSIEKIITKENINKQYNPDECIVQEDGNLKCSENGRELNISENLNIEIKGEKPTSGIIRIKDGKIIKVIDLYINGKYYSYDLSQDIISYNIPQGSGLYDENYKLIATWSELVNKYGLDVSKDYPDREYKQNNSGSMYDVINRNSNLANGKILIVSGDAEIIGNAVFAECNSLTTVIINDGVKEMGGYLFYQCRNLVTVYVSDTVETMGNNTFYYCFALENVKLSNSITKINDVMFYCCYKLKNIDIPESVTSIGWYAFNSSGLKSIIIPSNVNTIGSDAFTYTDLTSVVFENTQNWEIDGNYIDVTDPETNATNLKTTYKDKYWHKYTN